MVRVVVRVVVRGVVVVWLCVCPLRVVVLLLGLLSDPQLANMEQTWSKKNPPQKRLPNEQPQP